MFNLKGWDWPRIVSYFICLIGGFYLYDTDGGQAIGLFLLMNAAAILWFTPRGTVVKLETNMFVSKEDQIDMREQFELFSKHLKEAAEEKLGQKFDD